MKYERRDMIKYTFICEPSTPTSDLVDNNLVKLTQTGRDGDTIKLHIAGVISYHDSLKSYMLESTAGVSDKEKRKFVWFTQSLIPKDLDWNRLFEKAIPEVVDEKFHLVYDPSLGPEEMNNPLPNLAPRFVDVILYRRGLNIKDYVITSAHCEEIPKDIKLPDKKKKGARRKQPPVIDGGHL